MRHLLAVTALALLAAPSGAAPVPAKNALAQIPAAAPLVVQLRGIEGTADNLIAFLKKALPDQGPLIELTLKGGLQGGIDGRSLDGLAKTGPHFAALLEMPKPDAEGLPKAALVLSTTDNKKFLDGFLKESEKKALKKEQGYSSTKLDNNGEPAFIVERQGYVILTPREEVAKEMANKGAGLDTKISDELLDRFLGLDLSVYLSMDVLNKDYAEQIKTAKKDILDNLQNAPGVEKGQLELLGKVVETAFQAAEDSKGIVAGVEFKPTAVALTLHNEFRDGTPTSKLLAGMKTSKFEELGKLPAGQMFYIGTEATAPLLEALKGVLYGQAADPEGAEGKALAAAVQAILKSQPGTQMQTSSAPIAGLSVVQAADTKALLAAQVKLFEAVGAGGVAAGGLVLKEKPTIKADAEKYNDISFTRIGLKFDPEKLAGLGNLQDLPEEARKGIIEGLKKMMGESAEVYLGSDGKQVYQATARDWAAAKKLLDAYFAGKESVRLLDGFAQIRKDMPAETTFLALVDLPTYLAVIFEVARPFVEMQGLPIPPKYPGDAPKGSAGFIGLSATLGKERASGDLVISAESILVTYKRFVAPFAGIR